MQGNGTENNHPDAQPTRPQTRTERRIDARRRTAHLTRKNRDTVARDVANERGTLPDARELSRIAKLRGEVTARINNAATPEAGVEAIIAELPAERQAEARARLSALLPAQDAE
jgi:hypothetical protein